MLKQKLRVFEAFAGVGSQRMALRNLGIDHEVVGIAEIDKYALKSYEAIHGDCPNFGDISTLDPHTLPDMDMFTYSFPCQDLSRAGLQNGLGKGTRSGLLYECEKIIETKKPKYLLLENVKALVSKKFKGDFMKWLEYLESLGYTNYWDILNAKDYGVPHNRERVFVVSVLNGDNDIFTFPQPYDYKAKFSDIVDTDGEYRFIDDRPFVITDEKWVKARFTDTAFDQSQRIYSLHGPMHCLTALDRGLDHIMLDDGRIRRITPLERWRMMGFKDEDFKKAKDTGISNPQLCKQAGNSIVVTVLEAIFGSLFKEDENE